MLGIPRLFGRNDQLLVVPDLPDILEEGGILIPETPGMFAAEGCTLDTCYHAEHKMPPGCMQEVGLKVPGIDSVAAEEPGQEAPGRLRTGC